MANDIIDINVYETTETVSITVNPNLTTININEVTGVGGSQNLQSVTNFGNTTTTSITANSFIKSGGTGANVLLDNGTTTVLANLGTKNDINSKQLQLNYLDRDNSIFDAFYLRTIADGGTVEASNQLLSSLAVLRNISYVNQGYTQQINADKFVKLGGTSAQYLMADGSVTTGGGGGGGATNLAYTPSPTNGIVTSDTGTDATIPLADVTNAGLLTPSEKTKIANSVPYTGATTNVNLGEFGIQLGNLEFDNTPTNIPTTAGSVYYNDSDGTLDLILKGGNVTLQLGQENIVRVVNKTTTNISLLQSNYQAVRITGAQGQRPKVDLAQATNDVLSAETIGLVTETIANNQEGFIITSGLIRNINTTGSLQGETWLDGDILYLSPTVAGNITKVKPIAPNHLIIIGYVIYAHITQGTIFVKIDNGYELDELHNVKIATPANNSVLAYTLSTDIWENKTVETALGYTPYNATNPSGYQTASQVQTIADAKVANTITNGVTTSAPNQDVVFDALSLKANDANVVHLTGSETIAGTKTFSSNIVIPGTGTPLILSASSGGTVSGLLTTTYPDLTELTYLKGVTSSIQTQFSSKQDTLISGNNIKSINGNSILGSGDLVISGTSAQTGTIIVTSGTSFITPSNITTSTVFIIELVGAGGGGSGGLASNGHGSGAGGGGYVYKRITGLSPSTTYTCAIGTGGTGGAALGNGTAGTSTTLTIGVTTYTASGGGFGTATLGSAGGTGGTGSNGDINISGQNGDYTALTTAATVHSSRGGVSPKGWGLGGAGVAQGINGQSGTGFGGGGSAGKAGASTGGNGSNGIIYCQYFN